MDVTYYSPLFSMTVNHLLQVEGGYVNDPSDAGGETKFGISKRRYPDLNISSLTPEHARMLYHRDYWLKFNCDALPAPLAVFLFDCQVNHRPRLGPQLIQSALRAGLRIDGYIGPITLRAALNANLDEVMPELFAMRADFYHDMTLANSSQERFLLGWFRRLFELQQFIEREVIPYKPQEELTNG